MLSDYSRFLGPNFASSIRFHNHESAYQRCFDAMPRCGLGIWKANTGFPWVPPHPCWSSYQFVGWWKLLPTWEVSGHNACSPSWWKFNVSRIKWNYYLIAFPDFWIWVCNVCSSTVSIVSHSCPMPSNTTKAAGNWCWERHGASAYSGCCWWDPTVTSIDP